MGDVLCRLDELPAGEVARFTCRKAGRAVALLVVRREDAVFAYEDSCPHQFLPLTYRGSRVLSADGERLRCTSHGAEFAVADGRCVSGPCAGAALEKVVLLVGSDGEVRLEGVSQQ